LFIVLCNWKKKLINILSLVMLFLALAVAIRFVGGILYNQVPAFSSWFQEEHPSGNPMRVEQEYNDSQFNQVLDQFVIKLQDFYYEK